MAQEVRLRRRRRLRRKEAVAVLRRLREEFAMEGVDEEVPLEGAEADRTLVYLKDARVVALVVDEVLTPGLRGLLQWPARKRFVTVDMGAVRFVTNGADVMAPGITEADPDIEAGTAVWVRDETHGRPLAVGTALVDGVSMPGKKGKAVANHHTVGDPLWHLGDEPA